jgi:transcriptional antiterminator RfaH
MTREAEVIAMDNWFCLQTQPKHEHIAAAGLSRNFGLQVFFPRIRYKRATPQGLSWVVEPLFLNYVFAHFDLETRLRRVRSARGVRDVVHFGSHWPTVPAAAIEELRAQVGADETVVVSDELNIGDPVRIVAGPMLGLTAVVTRAMPGPKRVAVLLDFLGRQTAVELPRDCLVSQAPRSLPFEGSCEASIAYQQLEVI